MQIGMNLTAKLKRGETADNKDIVELYDIGLNIPTSMDPDHPFEFDVTQEVQKVSKDESSKEQISKETIMKIAFCDTDNIYAQVKPPKSLIELANLGEYIESFDATVTEGQYDAEQNKFTTNKKPESIEDKK